MPTIVTSTVLEAPASEVWTLLRDFGAIGGWHPALPPAVVEDGPADRVGAARVFPAFGGHREILLSLDDRGRTLSYDVPGSAVLPVRDYVATLRVTPIGDGGRSLVEWTGAYDCDAADEEKIHLQIREGIFDPGLAALRDRFNGGEA
jgi:hypothetical protein